MTPTPPGGLTGTRLPWRGLRELATRPFARDAGWLTVASAVSALASAVQGVVVARELGATTFGAVSLAAAYPTLVFSFFDARSSTTTVRYLGQYVNAGQLAQARAVCKLVYGIDIAIAFITFMVVVLTAPFVGDRLVRLPNAEYLLVVYACGLIPLAVTTTSGAVLTSLRQYRQQATTEIGTAFVRLLVVTTAVLTSGTAASVIFAFAASNTVAGIWTSGVAHRAVQRELRATWLTASVRHLRSDIRQIGRFLLFTDMTELATLTFKQLDIVLVGAFAGLRDAGLYRLAKQATSFVGLAIAPIQSVTYQRMMSAATHPLKLDALAQRFARSVGVPLGALIASGGLIGSGAVVLLAGSEFHDALPAVLLWIAAYVLWGHLYWLRPYYYASNWPRQWFILTALSSAVFLVAALPVLSLGGGFLALTVARVVAPQVANVGGLLLVRRLRRDRLERGWHTAAGRRSRVYRRAGRSVKSFEAANSSHASFLAALDSMRSISGYLPAPRRGVGELDIELDWIHGRVSRALSPEQLAKVARFQATLHSAAPPAHAGFDYADFVIERVERLREELSAGAQPHLDVMLRALEHAPVGMPTLSHPDIQPENLIWTSDEHFVVVDLELMSVTDVALVDLINTTSAFGLSSAETEGYIVHYVGAGGHVRGLLAGAERARLVWLLRRVASALERHDIAKAQEVLREDRNAVGDRVLALLARVHAR